MRASSFFIHTTKDAPAEAELVSHQLMVRAGFVRKAASGIYSWLPCGWRVVRKIAAIVEQEMTAAGCAEIFMPAMQPAQMWQESGRWQVFGDELLRLKDRHGRDFCLGPTHEESYRIFCAGRYPGIGSCRFVCIRYKPNSAMRFARVLALCARASLL